MKIYLVVSVGTKSPLVYIVETPSLHCWSTQSRVLLLSNQVPFGNPWLATKSRPSMLTPSSRSSWSRLLLYEGWGSPCPLHKTVNTASHQAGRSMTCWCVFTTPRVRHTKIQVWAALKHFKQGTTPCSNTQFWAILALSLRKLVLNKCMINELLEGFENFFSMWVDAHEL